MENAKKHKRFLTGSTRLCAVAKELSARGYIVRVTAVTTMPEVTGWRVGIFRAKAKICA